MNTKSKKFTYDDALLMVNNWAKNKLIDKNIDYDETGEIPYFIQYLNYRSKLILAKPRVVVLSEKFSVLPENQNGFDKLKEKITAGEDINVYLSKSSIKASAVDGMLDNFGIKHFHLGEVIENGFIKRTGEVALGFVTNDEVFFIISKQHGKGHGDIWYEKDVLEIIHKEKPKLIEHCKVKYMTDISPIISDTNDIKSNRNANINSGITLDDGSVYMPNNLGQTLAGFGMEHTMKMQYIAKQIYFLAYKIFEDNRLEFIKINKFDLTIDGDPEFIEFEVYNTVTNICEFMPFTYGKQA